MANEQPTAYPLAWPRGKNRTPHNARSFTRVFTTAKDRGFSASSDGYTTYRGAQAITVAGALARLTRELDLLEAKNVVISSNLELRRDGLPRSDRRMPEDPGVAVYFRVEGDPVALACDRFNDVAQNIAAIAAHVNASRAIERHGVGSLREIFRGYVALPGATAPQDWRKVLNEPQSLDQAERAYRHLAKIRRPDHGGSEAAMAALNAAISLARTVLK
jgi:hypothetical protein